MITRCRNCGGSLTVSAFDACWCTPEGREMIEGRSAETRSWQCQGCGAGLRWKGQYCQCGRVPPGSATRNKPMPWECLDGTAAEGMILRRMIGP